MGSMIKFFLKYIISLIMEHFQLLITGYSRQCLGKQMIPSDINSIIISYQRSIHSFILNEQHGNRWAVKENGMLLNKPSVHMDDGTSIVFGEYLRADWNVGQIQSLGYYAGSQLCRIWILHK